MIFIKTVLGNIGDREWADRLSAAESDLLEIDQWEAQKSRFRKTTAKGVEIAVSIDRGTHIRDGDVLLWDAQALSAVVAQIELRDVMIVHLDALTRPRARSGNAHMRRAGPRDGQSALAGIGQGQRRLCPAHRRSQGHGVRHEYAPF